MARNTMNNYDRLYTSMKESFTIENSDCSLGEYMLMKAAQKKSEAALPVALRPSATRSERTVAMICSYVEEKLTVKETPEKDTIIRAFPIRTSAAALLSAVVACTFMLSFAFIGTRLLSPESRIETVDVTETEQETVGTQETAANK